MADLEDMITVQTTRVDQHPDHPAVRCIRPSVGYADPALVDIQRRADPFITGDLE